MNHSKAALIENFNDYFSIQFATTPEQKQKVYEIRYRVYCEELQYEPSECFPNGQEIDEFDSHSTHVLITHKQSGQAAACVRIVESDNNNFLQLPIEKNFHHSFYPEFLSRMDVERESLCEVSRLAVDTAFRRRVGDSLSKLGGCSTIDVGDHEQRSFSLLSEAGFLAATAVTQLTGRSNILALMEPYLCRLMEKSGIYWLRVGEDVMHRGCRAAYYTTTKIILENLKPGLKVLYEDIYCQLEESLEVTDSSYRAA